jgi:uncharacterized short protein YbdD (DUF466 family)
VTGRAVLPRLAHALVRAARGVRWYAASLLGDHDYDRYVAHVERVHPGTDPGTVAQYWRTRHADQDAHPGARCC